MLRRLRTGFYQLCNCWSPTYRAVRDVFKIPKYVCCMVLVDDEHSSLLPTTFLFQHCYQ